MNTLKKCIPIFFLLMLAINISIYMWGNNLSIKIKKYETEMVTIKQENMEMEQEKASLQSLNYAGLAAKELSFTKEATPLYLLETHIAYKQ